MGADTLDDVGEWRIDVVRALAFDVVKLPDNSARAGVYREDGIARIDRSVVVCRDLGYIDPFAKVSAPTTTVLSLFAFAPNFPETYIVTNIATMRRYWNPQIQAVQIFS